MKKYLSLILAVMLIFLCSCQKDEPVKHKTADMLNITNNEETFLGCMIRLNSVIDAMSAKISILEGAHNSVIKSQNPDEYFLEEKYILTSFEPFILEASSIIDGFTSEMNNESAQEFYKLRSGGMDIVFESENENYNLAFVSESLVENYTAEYDSKNDSLRFIHSVEDDNSETVKEFLEFTTDKNGAYIIQNMTERCYIEFNENNEIVYFCCGKLNEGEFSLEESIYPLPQEETDGFWVTSKGKLLFSNIHTYENGVLTHEDRSSGPWKTIKINADDFASAFYRQ